MEAAYSGIPGIMEEAYVAGVTPATAPAPDDEEDEDTEFF